VGAPVTGAGATDGPVVDDEGPLVVVGLVLAVVGCAGVVVVVGGAGLVVVVVGAGLVVAVVGCAGVVVVVGGAGLVVVVVGSGLVVALVGSGLVAESAIAYSASGPAPSTRTTATSDPNLRIARRRARRWAWVREQVAPK